MKKALGSVFNTCTVFVAVQRIHTFVLINRAMMARFPSALIPWGSTNRVHPSPFLKNSSVRAWKITDNILWTMWLHQKHFHLYYGQMA